MVEKFLVNTPSLGISLLSVFIMLLGCTNDDNSGYIKKIEFDVNGFYSYSSNVAIDTTTFINQLQGYKLRIPFCETTNSGSIIVGADLREGTTSDQAAISIGIVRSTDGGLTFGNQQIIMSHTNESEWDRVMDGTILVDRQTGRVFVFAHSIKSIDRWEKTNKIGNYPFDCVYVYSDDDGLSWSEVHSFRDILSVDDSAIVSVFGGVGHGITMSDGTLVLPIQAKMANEDYPDHYNIQSGIAYSKDRGVTWRCESFLPCYSSECMAVEYEKGKLMLNCRSYIGKRRVFTTDNLGKEWIPHISDQSIIEPRACQGTLHKIGRWGFFLNPQNEKTRSNLTLQLSNDFTSWHSILELYQERSFGYSCLCNDGYNIYAVLETMGESIVFYRIKQE